VHAVFDCTLNILLLSHRAGFCWWGPGANIEDGSSLIIHRSSGSHKRSTNWANQYDIYFAGSPYWWGPGPCPLDPLNPALCLVIKLFMLLAFHGFLLGF